MQAERCITVSHGILLIRIINLITCTNSAILNDQKMDMTGRWTSHPIPCWHCPLLLGKRPGSGAQFGSLGNTAEATPNSLGCKFFMLQLALAASAACWAEGHLPVPWEMQMGEEDTESFLFVADPGWSGLRGGAG